MPVQGKQPADEDRVVTAVIAAPQLTLESGECAVDQRRTGEPARQPADGVELGRPQSPPAVCEVPGNGLLMGGEHGYPEAAGSTEALMHDRAADRAKPT